MPERRQHLPFGVHVVVLLVVTAGGCLFSAYAAPPDLLPLEGSKAPVRQPYQIHGQYDGIGRLTGYPGKIAVDCPDQTKYTAVLLAAGQSNSSNHAEKKIATRHPGRVFNYSAGKCYAAASPLLGASGEDGEFLTPLADELISAGTYKSVVIVSSGIADTAISRWQRGGDLNLVLLATVRAMARRYAVTEFIWHQGENDFKNRTSATSYANGFNSLLETLAEAEVVAPAFIAIATKCDADWVPDNAAARGQRQLVDNKRIYLGVDTDALLGASDRRDTCHFSESGQRKTALSYAEAIRKMRQGN
jgi:hypothetical protein